MRRDLGLFAIIVLLFLVYPVLRWPWRNQNPSLALQDAELAAAGLLRCWRYCLRLDHGFLRHHVWPVEAALVVSDVPAIAVYAAADHLIAAAAAAAVVVFLLVDA